MRLETGAHQKLIYQPRGVGLASQKTPNLSMLASFCKWDVNDSYLNETTLKLNYGRATRENYNLKEEGEVCESSVLMSGKIKTNPKVWTLDTFPGSCDLELSLWRQIPADSWDWGEGNIMRLPLGESEFVTWGRGVECQSRIFAQHPDIQQTENIIFYLPCTTALCTRLAYWSYQSPSAARRVVKVCGGIRWPHAILRGHDGGWMWKQCLRSAS